MNKIDKMQQDQNQIFGGREEEGWGAIDCTFIITFLTINQFHLSLLLKIVTLYSYQFRLSEDLGVEKKKRLNENRCEEKVGILRKLQEEGKNDERVVMVGDGF